VNENGLKLKHLEHLLAVAETGSFSRAAERECITQSALSRSIQSLEALLDGTLIDRDAKHSELTPFGKEIATRARNILHEASEMQRVSQTWRGSVGGTMRVGLGSGPAAILMTPLLRFVAQHASGLKISITRGPTELQLQQLRARQLDAIVADIRRVVPHPDLSIGVPTQLTGGFACRTGHPLAALPKVRFEDILRFPLASTPLSDEIARQLVALYGPRANPSNATTLACEDIASLIDAVETTDAIYMGVMAAAREGLRNGRLFELPISPRLNLPARFSCITLSGKTDSPPMSILRRFVSEHLMD
jgi:DNA-binding transcriptional LysR family regulator